MNQEAEVSAEVKKVKTPTEVTPVVMSDGRTVNFTGKRKLNKEMNVTGTDVTCTFDFRNGETRQLKLDIDSLLLMQFAGHGVLQKVGDETAPREWWDFSSDKVEWKPSSHSEYSPAAHNGLHGIRDTGWRR